MNVTDKLSPDRIDPRTIPEGIRQEALLRGLFSAVPEAVVLLDMHDRILKANPEFTKIFGYAQEDACGHLLIHHTIRSFSTGPLACHNTNLAIAVVALGGRLAISPVSSA